MCLLSILHWLRYGKFTTCLDHNVVRSIAVATSAKLLLNGNLISLTCNLVDPLCERGTIVAREAESVGLIQQVCRTMQRLRMDNIVSMIVFFKMQIFTF